MRESNAHDYSCSGLCSSNAQGGTLTGICIWAKAGVSGAPGHTLVGRPIRHCESRPLRRSPCPQTGSVGSACGYASIASRVARHSAASRVIALRPEALSGLLGLLEHGLRAVEVLGPAAGDELPGPSRRGCGRGTAARRAAPRSRRPRRSGPRPARSARASWRACRAPSRSSRTGPSPPAASWPENGARSSYSSAARSREPRPEQTSAQPSTVAIDHTSSGGTLWKSSASTSSRASSSRPACDQRDRGGRPPRSEGCPAAGAARSELLGELARSALVGANREQLPAERTAPRRARRMRSRPRTPRSPIARMPRRSPSMSAQTDSA